MKQQEHLNSIFKISFTQIFTTVVKNNLGERGRRRKIVSQFSKIKFLFQLQHARNGVVNGFTIKPFYRNSVNVYRC